MDVILMTNKTFSAYLDTRKILEHCLEIIDNPYLLDDALFCDTKALEYYLLETLSGMEDVLVVFFYKELG